MSQGSDDLRAQRLRAFDAFFAEAASPLQQPGASGGMPEAWFLGPKAENDDVLLSLIVQAVAQHCAFRRDFHPEDPTHVTYAVKQSPEYREAIAQFNALALTLFEQMRHSAPLFSMRYQSHMLWDQALPAVVGYIGALFYNQNNVAAEASPVTTWLEIVVGNDLCRMLGYYVPPHWPPPAGTIVPWGHITCDGSVANIEALWRPAMPNTSPWPCAKRSTKTPHWLRQKAWKCDCWTERSSDSSTSTILGRWLTCRLIPSSTCRRSSRIHIRSIPR